MWCQNLRKGNCSTCKALMLMSDTVQLVVLFMQLSTTSVLIVSAFSLKVRVTFVRKPVLQLCGG